MLVEGIRGKGDRVAHSAAKKIANWLAHRLANQVKGSNLERRIEAGGSVKRVFARNVIGLRAVETRAFGIVLDHGQQKPS